MIYWSLNYNGLSLIDLGDKTGLGVLLGMSIKEILLFTLGLFCLLFASYGVGAFFYFLIK